MMNHQYDAAEKIEIVKVNTDDVEPLQKIARQTFYETYADANTEENMKKYVDEWFSTETLTTELNTKSSQFYFAIANGRVIGYLKVNFGASQTELKDDRAIEIERIYVLREFQGKKIGQRLYEKAMQIATEANADYIWLGVWDQNPKALKFYKKNGFVEFDQHTFKLGTDEQTDFMMKLQLTKATTNK